MSSGGSRTETTIQNSEPWPAAQPYLTDVMRQAKEMFNSNVGREQLPFSTFIPFSNQTNQALALTENRARNGSPLIRQANQQVGQAMGGTYNNSPANTYLQSVARGDYLQANPWLDANFNRGANQIVNQINATAGLRGRAGSGVHQQLLQRGLGSLANQVYGQNYEQERARQMSAIGALQGAYEGDWARRMNAVGSAQQLAELPYKDAQMLAAVGQQREDKAGQKVADLVDRHNFSQQNPWELLRNYSGMVTGYGGLGSTSTTKRTLPKQNTGLGILGAGISVLGGFGPFG